MAFHKASALLLKIRCPQKDDFITVAGIEASEIRLRSAPVTTTRLGGAKTWRETLPASSLRSLQISGRGYFIGSGSDQAFRQYFFSAAHPECEIAVPELGRFQGPFALVELVYLASENEEIQWRIKLQSAGFLSHDTD